MVKYRQVKAPENYPGKVYSWRKRVLEHHLVWWQQTGQLVPEGWDVHHKNKDGKDNRFCNLMLKRHGVHSREHLLVDALRTQISCCLCGKKVWRLSRVVRMKRSAGQINFFCCKSHAVQYQHQHADKTFEHGTSTAYRYHQCRCVVCKKAHSNRINIYKKKQRAIRLAEWH